MNSRFINVTDKIILEYSNLTHSNLYTYDIVRGVEKSFYISYDYANEVTSHRDNGVERLETLKSNKWLYLDVDRFKSNLGLNQTLNKEPLIPIYYNKLKIHILSGYTFSDIEGFILKLYLKNIKDENVNLLNFAFLRDFPNNTIQFNPEPLYINSKYYNRYIELDVLSAEHLFDNNYRFILNDLSNYDLNNHSLVYIDYYNINHTEDKNSILITDNIISRSTPVVDKYKYFSLKIEEVGDYFEHYATFKGGFPTEFIDNMAQMNRLWVITHKIEVFEQIGLNMIKTEELEKIQRSNFNKPLRFRPIIENANNAFSFTIKYTVIFHDTTTNEQFYRVANIAKLNPKKYGENLLKLNTSGFTKIDLYHKQAPNVFYEYSTSENGNTQTKVINHYLNKIYAYNRNIEITPFTNVYEFIFNDSIAYGLEYFLVFISDDEEKLYIPDLESFNTDTSLFFKIIEQTAIQIRRFKKRKYYIIGVNENGESTVIDSGTFYNENPPLIVNPNIIDNADTNINNLS